jgi:hypothetical protein
MLASTILTDVRRELLETTGAFWSDTELLRHLNRAEMDFINRTRLLEDKAFLTTAQGVADYPLPDNWLSAKLVLINTKENESDDDAWQRIEPTSLEKMGQGTPARYWIWNKRIYLTPPPDSMVASNLYLFYKAKPIELLTTSQSINVDDTLAEGLIAYILWKAWTKAKETSLAEEQKQIYANYVGEGRRWAKRRSGDQRNKVDIISATPFIEGRPFDTFPF